MKPRFRGTLAVSPCPGTWRYWYFDRALTYVRPEGNIKIPRGFETDWASTPRATWAVFPPWDTYGEAAGLHDWLYWSQPVSRAEADAIFYEAMEALGVPPWKRWALYAGVRAFGQWAWDSNATIGSQGYSRIRTPKSPAVPEWRRDA